MTDLSTIGLNEAQLAVVTENASTVDANARVDTVLRAAAMLLSHANVLFVAHGFYKKVAAAEVDDNPYLDIIKQSAAAAVAAVPEVQISALDAESDVGNVISVVRFGLGGIGLDMVLRIHFAEKCLQLLAGVYDTGDDEELGAIRDATPEDVRSIATTMLNAAAAAVADFAAQKPAP